MKNRNPFIIALMFLLVVPVQGEVGEAPAGSEVSLMPGVAHLLPQLRRKSLEIFGDHDGRGAVVALVDENRLVWCFGMGYRDAEKQDPVTCDTEFQIGTASALFTIAGALKLIEQRKLSGSGALADCSPSVQLRSRFAHPPLTIREALRHHSGLPKHQMNGKWRTGTSAAVDTPMQVDAIYPPGFIFSMSDVAMTMLGDCISGVAGKTFPEFLREDVLIPLGMTRSRFVASIPSENIAHNIKDGKKQPLVWDRDVAAGGMIATAREMASFLTAHVVDSKTFPRNILSGMHIQQNKDVTMDLGTRIGNGWVLDAFPVGVDTLVSHFSGDAMFHRSQIVYVPELKAGVVVLANHWRSRRMVDEIAREVLTRYLADRYPPKNRQLKNNKPGLEPAVAVFDRSLTGNFASWKGKLRIENDRGEYKMHIGGRTLDLLGEPGGYVMEYRLLGIIPIRIPALREIFIKPARIRGQNYLVANFRGADFIWAEQIHDSGLVPVWKKRLGSYTVLNQDEIQPIEQMELVQEDDLLLARFTVPGYLDGVASFPLRIVNDREAIVAGLGNGFGETVRVLADDPARIVFSGYVAQQEGR